MEYDAFISYRRSEVGAARALTALLRTFGQRVFLDVQNIRLGRNWSATIFEAARNSRAMIVLWSRSARQSSFMPREWAMAAPNCAMIPVRLDKSPLPPQLEGYQALTGLGGAERIMSRCVELTQVERLSAPAAHSRILTELRDDGVQLTPEQEKSTRALLGALAGFNVFWLLSSILWWVKRAWHVVLSPPALASALTLGVGVAAGATLQLPGAPSVCPEPQPPQAKAPPPTATAKLEPPEHPDSASTSDPETASESGSQPVQADVPLIEVPSVLGRTPSKATALLEKVGFKTGEVSRRLAKLQAVATPNALSQALLNAPKLTEPSKELVVKQTPKAGKSAPKGSEVHLTVDVPGALVPDVRNHTLEDATAALKKAGLKRGEVKQPKKTKNTDGTLVVRTQSPSAETRVMRGSSVKLTVTVIKAQVMSLKQEPAVVATPVLVRGTGGSGAGK